MALPGVVDLTAPRPRGLAVPPPPPPPTGFAALQIARARLEAQGKEHMEAAAAARRSHASNTPKESIVVHEEVRPKIGGVDKTTICAVQPSLDRPCHAQPASTAKDSIIVHKEKRQKTGGEDKTTICVDQPSLLLSSVGASKASKPSSSQSVIGGSAASGPGFHVVFIIDTSKSMNARDVWQDTGNAKVKRRKIRRIDAVWDAVESFSKLLMPHPDVVASVVLFNVKAWVALKACSFRYFLTSRLSHLRQHDPKFGGDYLPALSELRVLHKGSPGKVTVGVMLSDGRPGDDPFASVAFAKSLCTSFGPKLVVHTVMFGPEAGQRHGSCLENIAKAGGGTFHANQNLSAAALQATFVRLSATVSTLRSSVLAFGEKALKRVPEKVLEEAYVWEKLSLADLSSHAAVRHVKGYFMLPAKGGDELELHRTGAERVAYLHKKPFAQGAQRYASHLWWIAPDGKAWHLVLKESKFEGAHETPKSVHGFFLKNHRRAQALVAEFNVEINSRATDSKSESQPQLTKIRFTPAYVIELSDPEHTGFRYVTCEKYIEGKYVKFSSNDGWVNQASDLQEDAEIAAAFSHFSFQQCDGDEICVDIQGVGLKWTDPQLHSKTREYGAGDLGEEGMKLFFRSHVCNKFCSMLRLNGVSADDLSTQMQTTAKAADQVADGADKVARDNSCLICLDRDRTVVNRPCMHLCLCESCYSSQQAAATKCIICRKAVTSVLKLATSTKGLQPSTYYVGRD